MTPLIAELTAAGATFALVVGALARHLRKKDRAEAAYAASYREQRDRLVGLLTQATREKRRSVPIRAALDELNDAFERGAPIPVATIKPRDRTPRPRAF